MNKTERENEKARTEAYVAGLEAEKEGYELRLKGAKQDKDEAKAARMKGRLEAIDAEIARAKKQGQTPPPRETTAKAAPETTAGPAAAPRG